MKKTSMGKSKFITFNLVLLAILTGSISGYLWGVEMLAIVSISTFLIVAAILAKMGKINYKS